MNEGNQAINNKKVILSLNNISKFFSKTIALDDVSINIHEGEILAILGENGAGKSTLMKILCGLFKPDTGSISINSKWFNQGDEQDFVDIQFANPRESMKCGIGMVYQHFQLVNTLSVKDNITLGIEQTYRYTPLINAKETTRLVKELGDMYGLPISPNSIVEDLPVGLKQRVEILKQLYRNANLLILDEPTAVLTPTEVEELFKTMRKLRDAGKSIIFISHKLYEPMEIADRIIVIRKGKVVGETSPSQTNESLLAEMVIGKKILQQLDRKKMEKGQSILKLKDIYVKDQDDKEFVLNNINMEVFENQILGVAGVQGNGQTELVESIIGIRRLSSGEIKFTNIKNDVIDISELSIVERLNQGIGYIPEDRNSKGIILDFRLNENVWLAFHSQDLSLTKELNKLTDENIQDQDSDGVANPDNKILKLVINLKQKIILPFHLMHRLTQTIINNYDVRTPSDDTIIKNLSGGNQQKVLLGREFIKNPRLIIASQPTRGVDVGVMEKVHLELINRRNEGSCIILVSSDLDEILKLSDYIVVLYEGKIVGQGSIDELSTNDISQLMTGGKILEVTI
ncbi:MAG: ABC transporter ATP-binding protein [Candidatus Heimdallarchaeota archaeon]|nr:ABC transporter ATP-binding protein [Candidatus Heimdallarchaeota archaeon]MDH5644977.1 ABC transporter ATP-binding protein [Candidatus Heimdallarchaeota archaeon]